jgi:hypothetical protein
LDISFYLILSRRREFSATYCCFSSEYEERIRVFFYANGVTYHYIKSGLSLWSKVSYKLFDIQKKRLSLLLETFYEGLRGNNARFQVNVQSRESGLCNYFLNTECSHKVVIMQTLMNYPKRISMGISTDYRKVMENRVLSNCRLFAIPNVN